MTNTTASIAPPAPLLRFNAPRIAVLHEFTERYGEDHPRAMLRGIHFCPAPAGIGGAYGVATDGRALAIFHDAAAICPAPITLRLSQAALGACHEPEIAAPMIAMPMIPADDDTTADDAVRPVHDHYLPGNLLVDGRELRITTRDKNLTSAYFLHREIFTEPASPSLPDPSVILAGKYPDWRQVFESARDFVSRQAPLPPLAFSVNPEYLARLGALELLPEHPPGAVFLSLQACADKAAACLVITAHDHPDFIALQMLVNPSYQPRTANKIFPVWIPAPDAPQAAPETSSSEAGHVA